MVIYAIKPKFQQLLRPVEKICIKFKIHPTTINILALILSIIGGLLLYYSDRNIWLLAAIPFVGFIRMALNALDGMVARTLKVKNKEFGEVLNEFIDRVSDAVMFLGFALTSYVSFVLGGIVTILILLSSYLGIVSKAAGGSRIYIGLMGKSDRMFALSLGCVLILILQYQIPNYLVIGNYTFAVIGIGMIITIIQRFISIKKELYK